MHPRSNIAYIMRPRYSLTLHKSEKAVALCNVASDRLIPPRQTNKRPNESFSHPNQCLKLPSNSSLEALKSPPCPPLSIKSKPIVP